MSAFEMAQEPAEAIHEITREAREVLRNERSVLLEGQYESVPALTKRKEELLMRLEVEMRRAYRTRPVVDAVSALIADSRRNEQMINAAINGVAQARRKIKLIVETGRGAVAYAEDGSLIRSRDDAVNSVKRA